ncbi:hypothetical protein KY343_01360 [Candidatus Woesearchaeota archaeon]|nr:hypothetical protein [Candidatus Woesearchaeota archaeon]
MKWFVYTRGTIPLHRIAPALASINECSTKLNDILFDKLLYINEKDKLWFAWDKEQITEVGRKILEKIKTKEGKKTHFNKIKIFFDKAIKSSERIRKLNLKEFDNEEIIKLYKEHYDNCKEAHGLMDVNIDAIDIYPVEYLKEKIKKSLPKNIGSQEFIKIYTKLTTPTYKTYVKREEIELLKIASKIRKQNLSFERIKPDLKRVIDKFWWTSLGFESIDPKFEEDFLKALKEYLRDIKDPDDYLKKSEKEFAEIKKQRDKLIENYNLSKEIQDLIKLFDDYALFHDLRKEMQVRTGYSFQLLMYETARRLRLDKKDLEWYWPDEVCDLLKNKKFNKKEADKRIRAVCVLASEGTLKTYSGDEAVKIRKQQLEEEVRSTAEIIGTSASPGKVIANVKVCNGAEDALRKIQKGDVLVCGMTLPDYVPAMKKAAAIITDEGGITCHAAIISREFNIPCITGTRIATKVLKDGDLIEIDADNGIIKKLEK